MLYLRLLTAFCLIPFVLWGVIKLPHPYFELLFAGVALLGALEWANLCHFTSKMSKSLFALCVGMVMFLTYYFIEPVMLGFLWASVLFWCYAFVAVFTYSGKKSLPLLHNPYTKASIGVLVLVSAWYALTLIRRLDYGAFWVIVLFALIWSSDSIAYFVGKKWGKTPLVPFVSPKKTGAGFWGGLIGPLLLVVLCWGAFQLPLLAPFKPPFFELNSLPTWLSLAFVTLLFGIGGDLFESLIKRISGVKDSGTLLPGHGGVLDRIDSLLSALPFFALSLVWLIGQ